MSKKSQAMIVVGVIVIAGLALAATSTLYYLREDSSGQMLWNGDEAYLFMTVARRGVRVRVLDYPWMVLSEWLRAPCFPTDQRVFLTVIHVTPAGSERHLGQVVEQTADTPHFFTPIDQTI